MRALTSRLPATASTIDAVAEHDLGLVGNETARWVLVDGFDGGVRGDLPVAGLSTTPEGVPNISTAC